MTVNTTARFQQHTGNGVTTSFAVPFQFYTLEVYVSGSLKTLGVDYTLTGGSGSPGTVVFNVAPANAAIVSIVGSTPIEKPTQYRNFDDAPADLFETSLDKSVMMIAESDLRLNRGLRDAVHNPTVPALDFVGNPDTIVYVDEDSVPQLVEPFSLITQNGANGLAEYLVAAPHVSLPNARICTDSSYLTWDLATPGQVKAVPKFTQSGTGAILRNLLDKARETVHVLDFVPVAMHAAIAARSGTDDHTSYVQAALDYLGGIGGGILRLPRGQLRVTSVAVPNNVTIIGEGDASRVVGTTATANIFELGNGSAVADNPVLKDFVIWSTVNRTAGAAVRGRKLRHFIFDNLMLGTFVDQQADGDLLWDGLVINEFAVGRFCGNSRIIGCDNDGLTVYGNSGQTFGVEFVVDATVLITGCGRDGIHVAGGAGGVKLDCNVQQSGRDGLRITDDLGTVANREVFLGPNFSSDDNTECAVRCMENSTLLFLATGSWAGGSGFGWAIDANQPTGATFRWTGGQIFANDFHGITWSGGNLILTGVNCHFNGSNAAGGIAMHGIDLQNTGANDVAIIGNCKVTNNGNVTHGGYNIKIAAGVNNFNISGCDTRFGITGSIDNQSGFGDTKRVVNNIGYTIGDTQWFNLARPITAAFRAHKNGTDQTGITSATPTTITWGTEAFDVGPSGGHFASNGWTPPAGVVRVSARAIFAGANGLTILFLLKNGSAIAQDLRTAPDGAGQTYHDVDLTDTCNGTDVYTAQAYITSGATGTVEGDAQQSHFHGVWLGKAA